VHVSEQLEQLGVGEGHGERADFPLGLVLVFLLLEWFVDPGASVSVDSVLDDLNFLAIGFVVGKSSFASSGVSPVPSVLVNSLALLLSLVERIEVGISFAGSDVHGLRRLQLGSHFVC